MIRSWKIRTVALIAPFILAVVAPLSPGFGASAQDPIPLPEHPRPDFQRDDWLNLNGPWAFRSWFSQKRDKKLREAGSYGYLVEESIPQSVLLMAAEAGEIVLRLEVDPALPGGLAIYGERFGRYPLDPTVVFVMK